MTSLPIGQRAEADLCLRARRAAYRLGHTSNHVVTANYDILYFPGVRWSRNCVAAAMTPNDHCWTEQPMITGVHALIYTKNADEVCAFFRDALGLYQPKHPKAFEAR